MNVSIAGTIQFQQSVGGPAVPLSVAAQATYTAYQQGIVDIPSGSVASTAFPLPMGGVATGKGYYIKANSSVMLGMNAATGTTQLQGIATGGVIAALGGLPAKQQAFTSLIAVLPQTAGNDGSIEYVVWGD